MSAAADFVHAVNAHDLEALVALMSEDHLFVDAEGNEFRGRDAMAEAWRGYFEWFPDYAIEVERTVSALGVVGFFGYASGTYAQNGRHWRLPSAWLAVERGGRVAEWRVYCDTRLPAEIVGT
jgi:ketosteroid isomerase-like protein